MDPQSQPPVPPLRWRGALRRILALLESGPEAVEAWDPAPREVEMLQMAGFGPLLAESFSGHPAFPALFAEEVLNRGRIEGHRQALAGLLQHLEGQVSPPVLLKGMAACDVLYSQPSLRVFTDIDLLIPAADLEAWNGAILSLGGTCRDPAVFGKRGFSARHYFQHAYTLPTEDPELRVELDLHLSLGPRERYPMDYEGVTREERTSERGPCRILDPCQWIAALAIHQARTLFVWSYQDYVDLFQILRCQEIREEELLETVRSFGALRASSVLLRNLRMTLPPGSAVKVPEFDAHLPAGHEEFREQILLPIASRAVGDESFLRNARRTARLTDSLPGLMRYLAVYAAKRGLDLVVHG